MAVGRRIGLLDLNVGCRDSFFGIADRRCDWPEELRRLNSVFNRIRPKYDGRINFVIDVHQPASVDRLVERVRYDQREWLASIVDLIVLKRQIRLPMWMQVTPWPWRWIHTRHVTMRENGHNTRSVFGSCCLNRHCAAVCYRAVNDRAMYETFDRNVCCVAHLPSHLQTTIHT